MGDVNAESIFWSSHEQINANVVSHHDNSTQYLAMQKKRARVITQIIRICRLTCMNDPKLGYTYEGPTSKS